MAINFNSNLASTGFGLCILLTSCAPQNRVATIPPPPTQTFQRQITNALDAGDGDYQTRSLREQVLAHPDDLNLRFQLAERYRRLGAPELTLEHYRIAVAKHPDNAEAAILLARTLRGMDRSQEAIEALAAYRDPNVLSLRGILQDDTGQFANAEKSYRAAIERKPDRADLHNNLGYNLLLQAKPGEAVKEFEQALKLDPRSEVANNNLGLALLAQWKDDSQPKEALLHWQSVSDPASAHNNLATVLIEQGRYADARKELEIALDYKKDHPAALRNLKLIAGLDGGPSTPGTGGAHLSFWKRVKTVFKAKQPPAEPKTAQSN